MDASPFISPLFTRVLPLDKYMRLPAKEIAANDIYGASMCSAGQKQEIVDLLGVRRPGSGRGGVNLNLLRFRYHPSFFVLTKGASFLLEIATLFASRRVVALGLSGSPCNSLRNRFEQMYRRMQAGILIDELTKGAKWRRTKRAASGRRQQLRKWGPNFFRKKGGVPLFVRIAVRKAIRV